MTDPDDLFWTTGRGTCYTASSLLCDYAEELSLYYKDESISGLEIITEPNQQNIYHVVAKIKIDGVIYLFDATPEHCYKVRVGIMK